MSQKFSQDIQGKTEKLTQLKLRYNELVKTVDDELSEQILHFNEKKIHIPLDIAKPILQALKTGNTKGENFISSVQQFAELINFFSDSEIEDVDASSVNEQNLQYLSNSNQKSALKSDDSLSIQQKSDNFSDDNSDVLNNFDSIHLNMNEYIEKNYNDDDDFNGI